MLILNKTLNCTYFWTMVQPNSFNGCKNQTRDENFGCLWRLGPPLTISNREVKPTCADGTALLRVGEYVDATFFNLTSMYLGVRFFLFYTISFRAIVSRGCPLALVCDECGWRSKLGSPGYSPLLARASRSCPISKTNQKHLLFNSRP